MFLLSTLYGPLVAATYIAIKHFELSGGNGSTLFTIASGLGFFAHFLLAPRSVLRALLRPKIMLRGLLFGLSQVFILQAQSTGSTTYALSAAVVGSSLVIAAAGLILKERISKGAFASGLLALSGCALNPAILGVSVLGVLGGVTQGVAAITTRSIVGAQKGKNVVLDTFLSVAVGLFCSMAFGALFLEPSQLTHLKANTHLLPILVVLSATLLTQYAFFALYRALPAHKASVVGLSRIPASLALEFLLVGSVYSTREIASALLVATGALALPFLERTKSEPETMDSELRQTIIASTG